MTETPASAPALTAELEWLGGTRLQARSGTITSLIDWESRDAPSPVQELAFALAGCMSTDVILILQKARVPPAAFRARLRAERAPGQPRRLLSVDLRFEIEGDVPPANVERAIALSREKYCSVWHSLRTDIELRTSFEVRPARP